ncbi:hypothetical protein LEP1GSC064_2400 [Leptospira kirschneri serovar Grippotyphosa str. Moskva]|nr:hypothetical protein LEP1GSC064_2400 [Leptospira kirschneri serovar Grippotyphosa str. Moskva]EKR08606.1 hypothetical protein LEP1GSC122_1479 [Leptospira kirschneri serovar Valbuzzi str. 200702274]
MEKFSLTLKNFFKMNDFFNSNLIRSTLCENRSRYGRFITKL